MLTIRSFINTASDYFISACTSGAVGYLGARMFTSINPVHGAVFCALASLVSRIVSPVFKDIFNGKGSNMASRAFGEVAKAITSITVSSAICTAAGLALPYASAIHIVAVMAASLAFLALGEVAIELTVDAVHA
jgi:hypothetical protein